MKYQLKALVACGLVATATARGFLTQNDNGIDALFNNYLARMGKSYSTLEEYYKRREIFEGQINMIQEHNARNDATYVLGLNKFSDLTKEEFESMFLGDNGQPEIVDEVTAQSPPALGQMAVSPIDWRDKGAVGPVKNQGSCGSCWSFSTTGPIEEHYAIKYGKQLVFAEQQLVDCSFPYGNNGCDGGLFANGYAYVKQFGLMLNSSYPYIGNLTKYDCQYDESQVAVRISGTVSAYRSPQGLKEALMNGPASISLHASYDSFRSYKSGIYNNATCPTSVNHAVQTVGWGSDNGQNYFIVRNSWGPSWGDQGYIKIAEVNTDLGICGMLYRVPMQPIIV